MLLRTLIWLALGVAVLVGSLQSALQQWHAMPIIAAAERFEDQASVASPAPPATHAHDHAGTTAHAHAEAAWVPANGLERLAWTWVANVLLSFSLALLLLAVLGAWVWTHGAPSRPLRAGLVVAAAGWLCLYLWPSLGLPPEIPGMDAARLGSRQGWWLLAAGSAGGACALLAWGRQPWRWLAAATLLAVPHLVGAPHLTAEPFGGFGAEAASQLQALTDRFYGSTAINAVVQWSALGLLGGWGFQRWLLPLMQSSITGIGLLKTAR